MLALSACWLGGRDVEPVGAFLVIRYVVLRAAMVLAPGPLVGGGGGGGWGGGGGGTKTPVSHG